MATDRGYEAYRRRRYFPGLNGVRAAAIAAVVWHHSYDGPGVALGRGFLGVDLFFVLSGFLIMTLLLRERADTGAIALAAFWRRRAVRLMPPYYLLLAITGAAALAHPHGAHAAGFLRTLPTDLLYLSNWVPSQGAGLGILWSLATEQQFYLVWPLVLVGAPMAALPLLTIFLVANQWVNFHLHVPALAGVAHLSIVQATFTPIGLGVVLAGLLHRPASFAWTARLLGGRWALPLVLGVGALLVTLAPADIAGAPRLVAQLLAAGLVGALVLRPQGRGARWLERPPVARVGIVSYGMYLYHLLALAVVVRLADGAVPRFALVLVLSWLLAEASYRLLEQPLLRWSRAPRWPLRRVPPGA